MIVKAEILEEDVYEQGKRAFLNFGHTYGHAIESVLRLRNNLPWRSNYVWDADCIMVKYRKTGIDL